MNAKILIHICCAPCFVAPYFHLKDKFRIFGFWFNPNIHPFLEYQKRLKTLQDFAEKENIQMIYKDEYNLEEFLRKAAFRENNRCQSCYYDRLKYYSKFQKHEMIKEICESLAIEYKVNFLYQDFREYWKEGIKISKERGMYRQQYCGCIFSERDRFQKDDKGRH